MHANDTIILRLLTLTRLPSPLFQPTLPPQGIAFSMGSPGMSLAHAGMQGPMTAREQNFRAVYSCFQCPQQQCNVYSLHINTTLFSTVVNDKKKRLRNFENL